jgi:hypothetical protein
MTCPCGRTFTAERSTAKYCCPLHRLQAHRGSPFTTPPEERDTKTQTPPAQSDQVAWTTRQHPMFPRRFWVHFGFQPGLFGGTTYLNRDEDFDVDGLYWCGFSNESKARRDLAGGMWSTQAVHLIEVEDPGDVFRPTWWLQCRYGDDPYAQAIATLMALVSMQDWPHVVKHLTAAFHQDGLSRPTPAAEVLVLILNTVRDKLKKQEQNKAKRVRWTT